MLRGQCRSRLERCLNSELKPFALAARGAHNGREGASFILTLTGTVLILTKKMTEAVKSEGANATACCFFSSGTRSASGSRAWAQSWHSPPTGLDGQHLKQSKITTLGCGGCIIVLSRTLSSSRATASFSSGGRIAGVESWSKRISLMQSPALRLYALLTARMYFT
jgi:hypothetical protein